MESNKEILIQKIIGIITEEDNQKSGNFVEKLYEFVKEDIVKILIHLDEIDKNTENISFSTKINVYGALFSRTIYETTRNKVMNKNDTYYGLFLYGGIICESLKINLHENVISSLKNKKSSNNSDESDIARYAVILACNEKKRESIQLINELYNDVKTYFEHNEIYQYVTDFIQENNIQIE